MEFLSNLHTHTFYSDGTSTPEQYIEAALEKGFVSLGFSEHAYSPYDIDSCIPLDKVEPYKEHVQRLREQYAGKLEIYTGIESDWLNPASPDEYDFIIGSVHCLKLGEKFVPVDARPAILEAFLANSEESFTWQTLVEQYYRQVADMVKATKPTIVGHLDLITKFNEGNRYFDVNSGWYQELAAWVVEEIAKTDCIVEVNTGAISRGYTTVPYPSDFLLGRLRDKSIPLTVSSDAHSAAHLDYHFDQTVELLKAAGFSSLMRMQGGSFERCRL
ncbi:histidinol-phosphatase [Oscillospiraceae bacterium MB08-C2-2]|nr:histidinol-phosphatase [Oscillospiraceae bacterium MB08-C2-2]